MRRGEIIPSVAAGLALLAGAPGPAHAAGYSEFLDTIEFRGFRAEASYTTDDNVTRAPAGDALRDRMLGVRVSAVGVVPLSTRTRAAVQGYVGTQRFSTYTGLSNNFIGAQGDFSFRPSGEFGAPTYGVFVRTAKEEYESTLRDGYRHAFGATVLKPLTDRVSSSARSPGTSATERAPSSTRAALPCAGTPTGRSAAGTRCIWARNTGRATRCPPYRETIRFARWGL